jgi:hypothetical protein
VGQFSSSLLATGQAFRIRHTLAMSIFSAYATNFEFCDPENPAGKHLIPLFSKMERVDFHFHVANPSVNQGQMRADLDDALKISLLTAGANDCPFPLPREIAQELDFTFAFHGRTVAVEIEKANREKILRDLLKSHMYLNHGADFALIVLPRNYPHALGIWDLFSFGVARYRECLKYGLGTPESLGRVLLVGYTQYDAQTGEKLNTATRQRMRKLAVEARDRSVG